MHKNDKSEIHCCLHNNLDPLILEIIFKNQFPGLVQKMRMEKKGFQQVLEFMEDNKYINFIKVTITRLIRIELEYLDILKDSFLAYSLYRIVGGNEAILSFPKNFSIIIVLCFSASVIIPIFFATLHLAMNNPSMVFFRHSKTTVTSKRKKVVMTFLCCLLSFLNPILLVNAYEGAKERSRSMAKALNENIILEINNLRDIKNQWITFIKIELGKLRIVKNIGL